MPSSTGNVAERILPEGFDLTPDLRVGALLHRRGMIYTYRCRDRSLDIDVLLKEYFPPGIAIRADDHSVAPAEDLSRTLQHRPAPAAAAPPPSPDMPVIPLSSTLIVRGWKGGDSSPAAIFAWGLDRFLRQARVLAQLDHPGIERVFRVFSQNGTAYMTVQWTDGATLEDAARARAFSQDDLDLLLSTILDAISLLHGRGIVHCDVAPRHIVVRPDGRGVLTDIDPSMAEPDNAVRQETTMIITPSYSPPEAYHGARIARITTDIFGLASSLYYAIARAAPPDSSDAPASKLESMVEKGRYRTSFLRAIDWARTFRPSERPESAEAWKRQLLAASRVVRLPPRQIFISYRRADSSAITRVIYQRLCSEFGAASVFFDVDTIPAGVDFRSHIAGCIDMTAVLVAVVGRRWLRRSRWPGWFGSKARKADDPVYMEIELALAAGTTIIPVLVHGASLPGSAEVPSSLSEFLYKNAVKVRDGAQQMHDLDRLVAAIRSRL